MSDQPKDPTNPSGPISVRTLKVHVDRDLCIGAATCVAISPKTFALDNEAKSIILQSIDEETDENIIDAAKSCPTAAIVITDQNGQKIFPK